MKLQRSMWVLLTAAVFQCSLGSSESTAQFIYYQPRGPMLNPPAVQPPQIVTWQYSTPAYNPYVAPFPAYGILPPPFLTAHYGWDLSTDRYARDTNGINSRATSEDYGYSRDFFDHPPRKRPTLSPAIPFHGQRSQDRLTDSRRVRFEITVPNPDAMVFFDGVKTSQSGTDRVFITPELDEGRAYTSTIEVRWFDEQGKERAPRRRTFTYTPGDTIRHQFTE